MKRATAITNRVDLEFTIKRSLNYSIYTWHIVDWLR
jgi:hypothetical protein